MKFTAQPGQRLLGATARTSATGADSKPLARHAAAMIALHWASAAAMLLSAAAALVRAGSENEALRDAMLDVHRQSGLVVLLALALRLGARWRHGLADHAGPQPRMMRLAARAAHASLYAMLAVLPLLGLATSQAHEVTVRLFGLWALPAIVEADPDLAERLSDYHAWSAWVLLGLLAAHVGAALWHHLVRKDGVLQAMLPWAAGVHGRQRNVPDLGHGDT
jgi:cytochrome b561